MCSYKYNKNDRMSLWRENRKIVYFHPFLIYWSGSWKVFYTVHPCLFPAPSIKGPPVPALVDHHKRQTTCFCASKDRWFLKGLSFVTATLYVLKAEFLKILLYSSWFVFGGLGYTDFTLQRILFRNRGICYIVCKYIICVSKQIAFKVYTSNVELLCWCLLCERCNNISANWCKTLFLSLIG